MTEGEVNVPIAICMFKTKEWQVVEVHNNLVLVAEWASTGGNDKSRPLVSAKLADLMVKGRIPHSLLERLMGANNQWMQQKVCLAHFNGCTQEQLSELAAAVATCFATGMPRCACSSEQHQLMLMMIEETKEEVRGARKDSESETPTRQDCESNSSSSDGGNDEAVSVINEAEFDSKGLHIECELKA